ncbi:MAG: cobalamin-dependent protein [archaeon]
MESREIKSEDRKPNILLSSVFGPYAVDDEYGSRKNNPMELYHNQVTRVQGPFSLRVFHPSVGLRLIAANIDAPCTILDFPTLNRFIHEIKTNNYDIVGIGSITVNIFKVKKMCELVRKYLPNAKIVIGGTIANMEGLDKRIDADFIVKGDGLSWFRKYLGLGAEEKIRHPVVEATFGTRVLGININDTPKDKSAFIVPTLGCPMGCNFCMTSATFGGKGNCIVFYETGKEIYTLMEKIEHKLGTKSFFIMDENFLLHKKRVMELLFLLKKNNKSYSLGVFSSANAINNYSMDELVSLGISFIWIGLEGEKSDYSKIGGINTKDLVKELQDNGIMTLGSSIVGLEEHAPTNINSAVDWAVSHRTDFHQFMLYTALPGTPLHRQYADLKKLYNEEECPIPDTHGQYRFNYRHDNIKNQDETKILTDAFMKDFIVNGPSLARMIRTRLKGYKKYKNHPETRLRQRILNESSSLSGNLSGVIWAMKKYYSKNSKMKEMLSCILNSLYSEFGIYTRIFAPIAGTYILKNIFAEENRLNNGFSIEPKTLYVKNSYAYYPSDKKATLLSWVMP